MIIISVNPIQSHYEHVMAEVARHGEIKLLGYRVRNVIQLLEGSNRMAAAIALGVPITIYIPEDLAIMEHDIDNTTSKYTDSANKAAVYEVALSIALDEERLDLNCPKYDTNIHHNIRVFENGEQIL